MACLGQRLHYLWVLLFAQEHLCECVCVHVCVHVYVPNQIYQWETKRFKKNLEKSTYLYYSLAERPDSVPRLGNGYVTYGSVGRALQNSRGCLSSYNSIYCYPIQMICLPQLFYNLSEFSILYFTSPHFYPYWFLLKISVNYWEYVEISDYIIMDYLFLLLSSIVFCFMYFQTVF